MRIAALYDIHGNLPALDAVLADVRKARVDRIVIGGDVLPGPLPRDTLERVANLDVPTQFIRGNGDRVVSQLMRGRDPTEIPEQFREQIRWTAQQLTDADAEILERWPATLNVAMPSRDVLFCHATPRNDTDIFTRLTPDADIALAFADVRAALVVCGHTHMQFDRTINSLRVVNAGSVGMPFGEPGAYWLLIEDDVELRRTSYDLPAAAERIRASGYPRAEEFAKNNVLHPPSEATMLAAFSRV